jgi:hypothetical protein
MTRNPDDPNDPTEPLRPLHYERQLVWPWSLGQTDPVKLQKFARRAAMFRRVGCLVAIGIVVLLFGLFLLVVRQKGLLR